VRVRELPHSPLFQIVISSAFLSWFFEYLASVAIIADFRADVPEVCSADSYIFRVGRYGKRVA
jgi:hypothetical protein